MEANMTGELKNCVYFILRMSENVDERGLPIPFRTWPNEYHRGAMKFIGKIMQAAKFQWLLKKENQGTPDELVWLFDTDKAPDGAMRTGTYELQESKIEVTEEEKEALRYFYKKRKELPEMSEKTLDELEALVS